MDRIEQFFETIQQTPVMTLATAAAGSVTMRTVSPVYHRGAILIFTCNRSQKYRQLQANPHCCIAAGPFFAECTVAFLGATMADGNKALREAYSAKFPGAFDEGLAFGGRKADFLLLKPTRLTGWAFPDDASKPDGIPTVPFEIVLNA